MVLHGGFSINYPSRHTDGATVTRVTVLVNNEGGFAEALVCRDQRDRHFDSSTSIQDSIKRPPLQGNLYEIVETPSLRGPLDFHAITFDIYCTPRLGSLGFARIGVWSSVLYDSRPHVCSGPRHHDALPA
jgi:hypothetical protein